MSSGPDESTSPRAAVSSAQSDPGASDAPSTTEKTTEKTTRRVLPRRGWGWGTPLVLIACGGLFITSAISSDGTDLRPGRYQDLSALVEAEGRQAEALTARVSELDEEVSDLAEGLQDEVVDDYQGDVDALRGPAGLTEVSGAGITVTMSDAPQQTQEASDRNPNLFVVHQQDLEALINVLWAGGAEAVTVQGQRIVSTTGIKCQGNLVLVQGIPYPQPYEISAVGDPASLQAAIDGDHLMDVYRRQAADPSIQIGWDLETRTSITAPEYRGLLDLGYAEPTD